MDRRIEGFVYLYCPPVYGTEGDRTTGGIVDGVPPVNLPRTVEPYSILPEAPRTKSYRRTCGDGLKEVSYGRRITEVSVLSQDSTTREFPSRSTKDIGGS